MVYFGITLHLLIHHFYRYPIFVPVKSHNIEFKQTLPWKNNKNSNPNNFLNVTRN